MRERFKILFKVPQHRLMRGVYKITIGGKFYIGKASILQTRAYQHETALNKAINNYAEIKNLKSCNGSAAEIASMYMEFAQHIAENPSITHGTIEVIQRCISPVQLYIAEHKILRMLVGNRDCLNKAFYGTKPRPFELTNWDVKKVGKVFYYFDPSNPTELFPHVYNISAIGEISKPRR